MGTTEGIGLLPANECQSKLLLVYIYRKENKPNQTKAENNNNYKIIKRLKRSQIGEKWGKSLMFTLKKKGGRIELL